MHAERFKRAEMLFTSEDRWRIKYLDKKRWVQGKPQKATVADSLLWCLLGVCEGVSPSEGTPLLFQLHPTLLMTKVCTEVFVILHWFFSVCPTNTMFYTSFSMSLLAVNHSLERILQQKLSSAGPVGRDMKSKWGAITMLSQKKWQITSIAHPVLKHLSRNLSKNPYPCLRCSKLTRHIKCIYFCIGLPTALSPWSFSSHTPSPSYFPPRSLQGRDLCDSTCFQRHSGITAHRLQES